MFLGCVKIRLHDQQLVETPEECAAHKESVLAAPLKAEDLAKKSVARLMTWKGSLRTPLSGLPSGKGGSPFPREGIASRINRPPLSTLSTYAN